MGKLDEAANSLLLFLWRENWVAHTVDGGV
jgi:hypothetical protein